MAEVREQVTVVEEEAVEVRTVSMRPRHWAIVDREAASMGGSRSWAMRHIVEVYDRMQQRANRDGQG